MFLALGLFHGMFSSLDEPAQSRPLVWTRVPDESNADNVISDFMDSQPREKVQQLAVSNKQP